jgi:hypothetical protein
MMPAMTTQTLWDRIVAAVRKDPKRAGILTVLVAILAVLQVRLQMNHGEGGSRATAALTAQADNSAPTPSISGAPLSKPQDAAAALRAWADAPSVPINRNLFAVNLDRFPQDGARTAVPNMSTSGFWDELAKSMTLRADVRKERQILVENLQQQAGQMRLQSTVMGATPKAIINGELVGEGDVVASFRVLKIEPRRIIVEREGIKLEIQMK